MKAVVYFVGYIMLVPHRSSQPGHLRG